MFLSRTRSQVGLDIGSHSVKLVSLRACKGDLPFELTNFGLAELPDEAIVDGAIVQPDAVSQVVAELLDQHKVKSKQVAASISGNAVIVRRVDVPRMSSQELRDTLPYEADSHIPFAIDEVDLDFAILDDDEDNETMDVVLVAAKRDRIDEHVGVIEHAKREAKVMDIDAFAMQNAFEFNYPERQFEDVVLLNLGASIINMAVLEGGRPVFWRDIAVGVRQYVSELGGQFMLDETDAEEVLRRIGDSGSSPAAPLDSSTLADWSEEGEEGASLGDAADDPRVRNCIAEVSDRIINEIRKTFDFYQAQSAKEHFDAVFLAGGGAHVADLSSRLEEQLGWPVERFDPLRRVSIPESGFDPEYVWENGPQATVALGLALRGVIE